MIISPSILSADFKRLEASIKEVKQAPFLHIDIMDGEFVPNISFGPMVQAQIRPSFKEQVFDTHLMLKHPQNYVEAFAKAGSDYITFHVEADCNAMELIEKIHSLNVKAGISIKPGTDVEAIKPYLPYLDLVLVMSVEPGFGGQSFMDSSLAKIASLKQLKEENNYKYLISVDGGINDKTIKLVSSAGVDVAVVGSYLFKQENKEDEIKKLSLN